MRKLAPLLLTALIVGTMSMSVLASVDYAFSLSGDIEIDVDGTVRDVTLQQGLHPVIHEALDRQVRSWRFKPVVEDGRPVIALAKMFLTIVGERAEEGVKLRIHAAHFGEHAVPIATHPPQYPRDAISTSVEAYVRLWLLIGEDGKVIDAHAYQTGIRSQARGGLRGSTAVSGSSFARAVKAFEQASIDAAKRWVFHPDSVPEDSTIRYTIEYTLSDSHRSSYEYRNTDPTPAPWVTELAVAGGDLEIPAGQAIAFTGRIQLLDDVVGKLL